GTKITTSYSTNPTGFANNVFILISQGGPFTVSPPVTPPTPPISVVSLPVTPPSVSPATGATPPDSPPSNSTSPDVVSASLRFLSAQFNVVHIGEENRLNDPDDQANQIQAKGRDLALNLENPANSVVVAWGVIEFVRQLRANRHTMADLNVLDRVLRGGG